MIEEQRFPSIALKKTDHGYEATVAVALQSLLMANLLMGQSLSFPDVNESSSNLDARGLHANREAFLRALSRWPENVAMELSMSAMPDLFYKAHGKIAFVLSITVTEISQAAAKEAAVSRYLALMSLLFSHFTEAEFVPILNKKDLENLRSPFRPTHAVAVHRRVEKIFLTDPFQRRQVGLHVLEERAEQRGYPVIHRFPLMPSLDAWSRLMDTLIHQLDPIRIIVRLRHATLSDEQRLALEDTIRNCELYLSTGEPYQLSLRKQVEMIRDVTLGHLSALMENAFQMGVYVMAPHPLDSSLGNVLGHAITGRSSLGREQELFQGGFSLSEISSEDALNTHYFFEEEAFCLREAAAAFRLPSPPQEDHAGLPIRRSRTSLAMVPQRRNDMNECIELFLNEHHSMVQPVWLDAHDRMRHKFIIGQTGTGKSTLMESMIMQDIKAGRGLAVIDPHGDMVDSILGKIPNHRADDVILFDVLDRERPPGFNILAWSTIDERDLIIDDIYSVFDHLYDLKLTGGPIFESNLRGMLKLLMGDKKQEDFTPNLINFTTCYLSKNFRHWLAERVTDPTVHDFLKELERTGGDGSLQNIAPYITSKFTRYINDTTLMRIIGQGKISFDFDEIMNTGKILLVKLGKGRFGSQVSALLANMIVSRFKYAAMKRGDLPPENRRDFYLYVDECHNLPYENFTELLAEARKFRMALILATQYTAQLSSQNVKNNFLAAVIGNVGTIIAFRLGQEDARGMAPVFSPYFNYLDIIGLPNWQGYASLQIGGDRVSPFSFKSTQDKTPFSEEVKHKVRELSRFKYGTDAKCVDAEIRERHAAWRKGESGG